MLIFGRQWLLYTNSLWAHFRFSSPRPNQSRVGGGLFYYYHSLQQQRQSPRQYRLSIVAKRLNTDHSSLDQYMRVLLLLITHPQSLQSSPGIVDCKARKIYSRQTYLLHATHTMQKQNICFPPNETDTVCFAIVHRTALPHIIIRDCVWK